MIFNLPTIVRSLTAALIVAVVVLVAIPHPALADISNPAIAPELGSDATQAQAGIPFARYFITLWRGVIMIGAIMILIYFLWGAIEWITAGGDTGKVQKARDRITQSLVGFIILVSTVVIVAFIGAVFFGDSLNLFRLDIPTPGEAGGNSFINNLRPANGTSTNTGSSNNNSVNTPTTCVIGEQQVARGLSVCSGNNAIRCIDPASSLVSSVPCNNFGQECKEGKCVDKPL